MVREAVKYYSEQWYPYPYAHISSIEGPIEGMEYPMMTFDPSGPVRIDLQWVLAHELGHQWVPMIVGSNERLYPWMDEGFNTFIDLANAAKYFQGTPYGDSIEVHPLHLYPDHAIAGQEQPLITRPVESRDLFWTAYQKPALMMQMLRYEVLGQAAIRFRLPSLYQGLGLQASNTRGLLPPHAGRSPGWTWTGSGAGGSTRRPGSTRRWTPWSGPRIEAPMCISPTAGPW